MTKEVKKKYPMFTLPNLSTILLQFNLPRCNVPALIFNLLGVITYFACSCTGEEAQVAKECKTVVKAREMVHLHLYSDSVT